jgi:hypothetical protein
MSLKLMESISQFSMLALGLGIMSSKSAPGLTATTQNSNTTDISKFFIQDLSFIMPGLSENSTYVSRTTFGSDRLLQSDIFGKSLFFLRHWRSSEKIFD